MSVHPPTVNVSPVDARVWLGLALVLGGRLSSGEEDRARHPPDGHLDEDGPAETEGLVDEPPHIGGLLGAHAVDAKGLRELHEVWILERRAVLATPVLIEIAGDIAEGLVVEDDGDDVDAVLG